jgi:hypothetical protein
MQPGYVNRMFRVRYRNEHVNGNVVECESCEEMGSLLGSWWCVEATVSDVDVLNVDLLWQQGMQAVHACKFLRERVGHSVIHWLLHSYQATHEMEWSGPKCFPEPLS